MSLPGISSKSIIREKSIILFRKIDGLAVKYIKHNTLKYLYEKFVRGHIEQLINFSIPEAELKIAITEAFYEIKPIVEEFQIAHEIKEASKINSPEMTKKLMKLPDFATLSELLE